MIAVLSRFLIRFYRCCLSSRFPFRLFRCTFSRTESCSAYALRVFATRPSWSAWILVVGRLRRCGQACQYVDNGQLGWGELYDLSLPEIDVLLQQANELPSTRRAVHRGICRVKRRLGECRGACRSKCTSGGGQVDIVFRSLKGFRRSIYFKLGLRLLYGLLPVSIMLWLGMGGAAAALGMAGLLWWLQAGYRQYRRHIRLEQIFSVQRFRLLD